MNTTCPETLTIDGVEYVRRDTIQEPVYSTDGLLYVLVRCDRSGVFAGYLKSREGREVVLLHARWIWHWSGAATLFQLAQEGVKKPQDCKFPQQVPLVELLDAIQIIPITRTAQDSIAGVPVWKK